MSSDAVVEDLRISALPLAETAALICRNAGSAAAQNVFTLNLDHVVKMRKDAKFRAAYLRAGLITADGFPIVLACSLQGKQVSRVAGSDLIAPIIAEAARSGKSIYLFGSNSQVLTKTSRLLQERNAGLTIAGVFAPPQGFDPASEDARRCIEAIGNSGADLCFVALGAPKQELFADHGKSTHAQCIVCLHWRRAGFHRGDAGACTLLDAALEPGMAVACCQQSAAASLPLLAVHGCPAWHSCPSSARSAGALKLPAFPAHDLFRPGTFTGCPMKGVPALY